MIIAYAIFALTIEPHIRRTSRTVYVARGDNSIAVFLAWPNAKAFGLYAKDDLHALSDYDPISFKRLNIEIFPHEISTPA